MTWQPEIDEIARRAAMTRQMGGAEKVERQHAQGKLTVRERVERLVDPASFREIGAISGKPVYDETGKLVSMSPANTIFGRALVDLCRQDKRVVGVTAAMADGTGLKYLAEAMPERFYECT